MYIQNELVQELNDSVSDQHAIAICDQVNVQEQCANSSDINTICDQVNVKEQCAISSDDQPEVSQHSLVPGESDQLSVVPDRRHPVVFRQLGRLCKRQDNQLPDLRGSREEGENRDNLAVI